MRMRGNQVLWSCADNEACVLRGASMSCVGGNRTQLPTFVVATCRRRRILAFVRAYGDIKKREHFAAARVVWMRERRARPRQQ